jgi:hypothetical protein
LLVRGYFHQGGVCEKTVLVYPCLIVSIFVLIGCLSFTYSKHRM